MEEMVRRYARAEPRRFQADLFDLLKDLMHELNEGLHSGLDLGAAEHLYLKTLDVIRRLFTPMSARLEILDDLAAIQSPDESDFTELLKWSFDPRHLDYFFRSCRSVGWLRLLWSHEILEPGEDALWPAFAFFKNLTTTNSDVVTEWLMARNISSSTSSRTTLAYLWLGEMVGSEASPQVLEVVATRERISMYLPLRFVFLKDWMIAAWTPR
jgi:hypothetical protein